MKGEKMLKSFKESKLRLTKKERNKCKPITIDSNQLVNNEYWIIVYHSEYTSGTARFANNELGDKLRTKFMKLIERK